MTDFTAKAENEAHPIREYLSGTPHALVSSRTGYELRLTVLSLFCFAVTEQDGFTLSVADGDTVFSYDDCTVTRHERSVKAGKYVVDEYTIKAREMRKQVQENAG